MTESLDDSSDFELETENIGVDSAESIQSVAKRAATFLSRVCGESYSNALCIWIEKESNYRETESRLQTKLDHEIFDVWKGILSAAREGDDMPLRSFEEKINVDLALTQDQLKSSLLQLYKLVCSEFTIDTEAKASALTDLIIGMSSISSIRNFIEKLKPLKSKCDRLQINEITTEVDKIITKHVLSDSLFPVDELYSYLNLGPVSGRTRLSVMRANDRHVKRRERLRAAILGLYSFGKKSFGHILNDRVSDTVPIVLVVDCVAVEDGCGDDDDSGGDAGTSMDMVRSVVDAGSDSNIGMRSDSDQEQQQEKDDDEEEEDDDDELKMMIDNISPLSTPASIQHALSHLGPISSIKLFNHDLSAVDISSIGRRERLLKKSKKLGNDDKTIVSLKSIKRRVRSDSYAIIQFTSREAVLKACDVSCQVFGIYIDGNLCPTKHVNDLKLVSVLIGARGGIKDMIGNNVGHEVIKFGQAPASIDFLRLSSASSLTKYRMTVSYVIQVINSRLKQNKNAFRIGLKSENSSLLVPTYLSIFCKTWQQSEQLVDAMTRIRDGDKTKLVEYYEYSVQNQQKKIQSLPVENFKQKEEEGDDVVVLSVDYKETSEFERRKREIQGLRIRNTES